MYKFLIFLAGILLAQYTLAAPTSTMPCVLGDHLPTSTPFVVETPTSTPKVEQTSTSTTKTQGNPPPITTIIVNEVLPNPKGSDEENEFIEIKNIGLQTADLAGWKLGDNSKKRFTIEQLILGPGEIGLFMRAQTKISLNNTGTESVKIFDQFDRLVHQTTYAEKALDDLAYMRNEHGLYVWTGQATPGFANFFVDPDEGKVEEEKKKPEESSTTKKSEEVEPKIETKTTAPTSTPPAPTENIFFDDIDLTEYIEISEFLPNPFGPDEDEYIELRNPGLVDVNLSGLKLDDEEGGSRPYTFPEGTVLKAEGFLVFEREETGIALNNTADEVRVLDKDGKIIRSAPYANPIEAAPFVIRGGAYEVSNELTPGAPNVFAPLIAPVPEENEDVPVDLTLEQTTEFDVGDRVSFDALVGVLPGAYSSQYFYAISPESSSSTGSGVQIYMYKKDFPELAIGDIVNVTGELSESKGERRVKIKAREDIVVYESGVSVFVRDAEIANVAEEDLGSFVQIEGEITELKGSHLYLDDGTAEIKVYLKKGTKISKDGLALGQTLRVKGFVQKTGEALQILPRMQSDIEIEHEEKEIIEIPVVENENDDKSLAQTYIKAAAGGLASILVGLIARSRPAFALVGLQKLKDVIGLVGKMKG